MAKAAKKPAAKTAAKPAAKSAAKAKPEKKAASKRETPAKKVAKKVAPRQEMVEETSGEETVAPEPKMSKKEKAAKAAAEKVMSEDLKKWSDFKERFGSEKAVPYNMASTYEAHKPLQHKVLGWGYILSVQNDRLEVLFESGPKMLISNYKPS